MTPPSLGRIHSDDRALDALGGRRRPAERDELSDLLSAWVGEIDRTPGWLISSTVSYFSTFSQRVIGVLPSSCVGTVKYTCSARSGFREMPPTATSHAPDV